MTVVDDVRVVLVTAPDRETADALATALVEARLVACANILPSVTSVYRWEGAVERAEEVLLVLKTAASRVAELIEATVERHPYDVPEVLTLPVAERHGPYATWVRMETERNREEGGA